MNSSPSNVSFRWEFESENDRTDVPENNFSSHDQESTLSYTPKSDLDFGKLYCYFSNEVGEQRDPCIFHIVEADLPQPPENCSLSNYTSNSMTISCIPGYNGGLDQTFTAFIYDRNTSELITSKKFSDPEMFIGDLPASTWFEVNIFSVNRKGRSEMNVVIQGATTPLDRLTGK